MAKAPSLNIPITFSVVSEVPIEQLEATYRAHYLGSGPEVINELRSNAAHCLAIADMIERRTAEQESAEVDQLAELLHGVGPGNPDNPTKTCNGCRETARELIARGVKVGK